MVTIEIDVDESTLKDAEKALRAIGMDVQIAVNVFLRRVAIEKGFPMSMTASVSSQKEHAISQEDEAKENMYQTRSNNTITGEMVDELWQAFLKYQKGLGEISRLRDEVAENSGMNRGSAFIYLNILANLIKGEPNTRTLKMKDLEYLMEKIKSELGSNEYQNAIRSLTDSVPYWRKKLAGSFGDRVEKNLNSIWKE
ncbi:MAG: hypothetical protein KGZ45_06585 [Clostridium sp.]|nr:hypothetical protein [Clostridium sp.]